MTEEIENRMCNDDAWKTLSRSKEESYYDDMPDFLEGDEIDESN